MHWNLGDQIVLEMTGSGLPFRVYPAIVVVDSPDSLAFYIPAETSYLRLVTAEGIELPRIVSVDELDRIAKRLVVTDFGKRHRLVVARPGEHYAVDITWTEPEWRHIEWYVNIQAPFERTSSGFRTTDQVLDIVIAPDRSWRFKDMDELAPSMASGRLTPDEAASVRNVAGRVVRTIEEWSWPFDAGYEHWRPLEEWTRPFLPPEWLVKVDEV